MQSFDEGITLDQFLMESGRAHSERTGQFVTLLKQVTLAAKMVSARVNRAGLAGMIGATGDTNIQGEFVMKLDVYANETIKKALEHAGVCCLVVSEEEEELIHVPERFPRGSYVFCMDPLDGSSNIDVNATIGTIFGVFRRKSPEGGRGDLGDVLRAGHELIAAGYVVYGSGTLLVLASKATGVNGFTLDPGIGEFFLSHPDIKLEPSARMYSLNEAYKAQWDDRLVDYVESLKAPGKGFSQRYIGSLVADFHRNLLKGGLFIYPATAKAPNGKLRVLYEAFPLAYIAELAGGAATDGRDRILDLEPTELHQRTPLVIGNSELVREATEALSG
ncbi:MAG: class 1 fructose-bisphosphatase [Proteobacteria bacterium]|nr:class 1 fructose-bisphosphatase [Pseudomonadota bacterium]MCP4915541.1 class 1 fructose-bisphosphatase [Pseudomonadota bacterium]